MKVIVVANTLWNINNFRQPILKMLNKKKAEIFILAPFHWSEVSAQKRTKNFTGLKYSRNQKNGLRESVRSIREFRNIFEKIQPDLILLYTIKPNIYGNIAAAGLNIPVISTVTGLGYTYLKGGMIRMFSEYLYKFAFRKTKKIIFHNPNDLELFINQGLATASQCKVIRGSGVDTVKFQPQKKTKEKEKFVFIFIGRLLADKGIREYLTAAKSLEDLKNAEFHIVGGPYPQNPASISELEWLNSYIGKNVKWHDVQLDVRPFLAAADVMVLPSYREGLPMSVLEAMAMGKPIITTDVPGCRETVQEGKNGFLVPVKDSRALASVMSTLYNMPEKERMLMGERSREKAITEFSCEIVATAYEELIFD